MKYCGQCGTPMDDAQLFCPNCGKEQSGNGFGFYNERPIWQAADDNQRHPWITVFSFILPILAIIFYFSWRYEQPSKARAAARGGLYSVSFSYPIIGLVLFIVFRDSHRALSKGCGISAIAGVIFGIVCTVLLYILASQYDVTVELIYSGLSHIFGYIK